MQRWNVCRIERLSAAQQCRPGAVTHTSSAEFNDVLNLRCGFYCVQGSQQVFEARYGQDARHRCNALSGPDNKLTVQRCTQMISTYNLDNIRTPVIIGNMAVKYGAEGRLIRFYVHIIFVMIVYFHNL